MAYKKRIETLAKSLLEKYETKGTPIDVVEVATKHGLEVKPYDLGDVSGVLHINNDKGIIGYNPKHTKVRQRFTIAHELGHYVMHKNTGDIFIDNSFNQIHYRDEKSSTGEIVKEQEANAFAAALLMPEDALVKEIKNHNFDLADESAFTELADLFNVSIQAMTYRISNLKLF